MSTNGPPVMQLGALRFRPWPKMTDFEIKENIDPELLKKKLAKYLPSTEGFECRAFRVGSYNRAVTEQYRIPYNNDAMGVVVINTPSFFETTFKRWLQSRKREDESLNDFAEKCGSNPIRCFLLEKFDKIEKNLSSLTRIDVVYDFDFLPDYKPKVVMTTCGHVSGTAFFYRPLEDSSWPADEPNQTKKRRMGLSLHPKYGGHFAYRAVVLFPEVRLPADFMEKPPVMVLNSKKKQAEALDLFNEHWKDGRYRDFGDPVEKYSATQLQYFSLPPSERWPLIAHWFDSAQKDSARG